MRFRLSTLFLIAVLVALIVTVWLQERRWQRSQALRVNDILAVYIPGVLPAGNNKPQEFVVDGPDGARRVRGYPVVVQDDGTIALPYLQPISVAGRSPDQVRTALWEAYTALRLVPADGAVSVTPIDKHSSTSFLARDP